MTEKATYHPTVDAALTRGTVLLVRDYTPSWSRRTDSISGALMVVTEDLGDGNYKMAYGSDPRRSYDYIVHQERLRGSRVATPQG